MRSFQLEARFALGCVMHIKYLLPHECLPELRVVAWWLCGKATREQLLAAKNQLREIYSTYGDADYAAYAAYVAVDAAYAAGYAAYAATDAAHAAAYAKAYAVEGAEGSAYAAIDATYATDAAIDAAYAAYAAHAAACVAARNKERAWQRAFRARLDQREQEYPAVLMRRRARREIKGIETAGDLVVKQNDYKIYL